MHLELPLPPLARIVVAAPGGVSAYIVWGIIIAGLVAIALVACKAMRINIPAWALQIGGIVCIVIVALVAVRIVWGFAP